MFDANYHYTLTQAEHDALVGSIKVWTKQELLYSVGAGLLQPVVDTQALKEDANIVADHITILTPEGGVGRAEGELLVNISNWTPVDATVDFAADNGSVHGTITRTPAEASARFQAGMFISLDGTTPNKTTNGASYEIRSVRRQHHHARRQRTLTTEGGKSRSPSRRCSRPSSASRSPRQSATTSPSCRRRRSPRRSASPTSSPGSVTNGTITRADATTWTSLGFAVGQKLFVNGNTGNATDAGNYYTIKSIATVGGHSVITLADGETVTAEIGVIHQDRAGGLRSARPRPAVGRSAAQASTTSPSISARSPATARSRAPTAGSFITDGFQVGKYVSIQGSSGERHHAPRPISASPRVTATTITLDSGRRRWSPRPARASTSGRRSPRRRRSPTS